MHCAQSLKSGVSPSWGISSLSLRSLRKVGYHEQLPEDDGHISRLALLNKDSQQPQCHAMGLRPDQRALQEHILFGVCHWCSGHMGRFRLEGGLGLGRTHSGRTTSQDSVSGAWPMVPSMLGTTGVARVDITRFIWVQVG